MKRMLFPFLLLLTASGAGPALSAQNPQKAPLARLEESLPAVKAGEKLALDHLMDRSLYSSGPAQLQWLFHSKEPACLYVENDTLKKYTVGKGETAVISLQDLAQDSVAAKYGNLTRFPSIVVAEPGKLYMKSGDFCFRFDCKEKKTDIFSSLDAEAANLDFDLRSLQIAYTKKNNLYLIQKGMRFAISCDPDTGIVNGQVVHRNEFGITRGTFWSNSGQSVAYYNMDESMVQVYPITTYLEDPARVEPIRYPEAGNLMHKVRVGVFNTKTYENIFLEPFADPSRTYVTSVVWSPDDSEIYAGILDRNQKDFHLVAYDARTGKIKKVVFEEHGDPYVEPESGIFFRPGHPGQFIWMSERKGFNHMYLYNTDGKCLKAVTPENEPWMITAFTGFSPNGKTAYFMATKESPLESHLYGVDIDKGKVFRITQEPGLHRVEMDYSGNYFIDRYSNPGLGLQTRIIDKKGKVLKVLKDCGDPLARYVRPEMRLYTLKAADGKTDLYGRMLLPPDFDSTRKYPVLVYVYGGPHAQLVDKGYNYSCGTFLRFMAQEGYVVWTLDSRGSANRGFAFETAIHRRLGDAETADQMRGIDFLRSLPFVDTTRIGVDGWSYGGFMTLTLKTRYPDVFKVATAGGPVIDWAWYEVMYGERYMGTPQDNPEGYAKANLLNRVDSIRGKVMLIQGGLDPVVLPKQSTTFVQKCIQKNIPIDFFVYPNHEHNVTGPQRDHLFRKLYEYYQQNL